MQTVQILGGLVSETAPATPRTDVPSATPKGQKFDVHFEQAGKVANPKRHGSANDPPPDKADLASSDPAADASSEEPGAEPAIVEDAKRNTQLKANDIANRIAPAQEREISKNLLAGETENQSTPEFTISSQGNLAKTPNTAIAGTMQTGAIESAIPSLTRASDSGLASIAPQGGITSNGTAFVSGGPDNRASQDLRGSAQTRNPPQSLAGRASLPGVTAQPGDMTARAIPTANSTEITTQTLQLSPAGRALLQPENALSREQAKPDITQFARPGPVPRENIAPSAKATISGQEKPGVPSVPPANTIVTGQDQPPNGITQNAARDGLGGAVREMPLVSSANPGGNFPSEQRAAEIPQTETLRFRDTGISKTLEQPVPRQGQPGLVQGQSAFPSATQAPAESDKQLFQQGRAEPNSVAFQQIAARSMAWNPSLSSYQPGASEIAKQGRPGLDISTVPDGKLGPDGKVQPGSGQIDAATLAALGNKGGNNTTAAVPRVPGQTAQTEFFAPQTNNLQSELTGGTSSGSPAFRGGPLPIETGIATAPSPKAGITDATRNLQDKMLVPTQVRADGEKPALIADAIPSDGFIAPFSESGPQPGNLRTADGMLARPEAARMIATQMMDALISAQNNKIEISLRPEELGRVRMVLSTTDAGVSVAIVADRPETLDLMRRHIDLLADEFRKMGYENIGFQFGEHGSGGQMTDQSSDSDPGEQNTGTTQKHRDASAPVSMQATPPAQSRGLDLRL